LRKCECPAEVLRFFAYEKLQTAISRRKKDCYYASVLGECDSQMPKQPTGRKRENVGASPAGTVSNAGEAMQILFGENLRLARLKAGLTQQELAAKANIRQAHVSQIEGGKLNPMLMTMVALAEAVGKDLRTLLRPPTPPKADQGSGDSN
jgi:DNA-binding XRE family transcriptional regulator